MFKKLVMWSNPPESIIHGVDLKQQDRAYNLLPMRTTETLEVLDVELDFSSARRCSIFSMVKGLISASLAVGIIARPGLSHVFPFQLVGFPWIFQQFSQVWRGLLQKSHKLVVFHLICIETQWLYYSFHLW